MTQSRIAVVTAIVSIAVSFVVPSAHARIPVLPINFVAEDVAPGAGFIVPVALAFMPDGRLMVGEKQGRVWTVKNGVRYPTPLWQSQNEVLDESDRGLLGIAVDPNYAANHYVYFMYTVDPDSDGVDTNSDGFGRLVRYQTSLADSNVVDPATRAVLFGRVWNEGPTVGSPTHSIGALRWGRDGSLLCTMGDGAQFNQVDTGGMDAPMFEPGRADPYEDIGVYRSQYLGSLCGKLLRINPATGQGYPSNPFWDGNPSSVRSRVWAYGVRNPFRFGVRPGTGSTDPADGSPGTIYLGDVGWSTWEEANVIKTPGINLGWPCYEGFGPATDYQAGQPFHGGCDSLGTNYWNPNPASPPLAAWHHVSPALSVPPGLKGNASVGGQFYTGTSYPVQYRNRYFFMDYGADFIKVMNVDANDSLLSILPFGDDLERPVDMAVDPVSGDLVYVAIEAFEVRRIRFTGTGGGGNQLPVAVATAAPLAGLPPLAVNFSSAGSFDVNGDTLSTIWTFGDGFGSTLPNPSHVYTTIGAYTAILTLNDGHGGIDRDSLVVNVGTGAGFPTAAVVDSFNRADGPVGGAWVGNVNGLVIQDSMLTSSGGAASAVWSGAVFDTTQEAYFTLLQKTAGSPEHDLMLKVQGVTFDTGHIEVRYDDAEHAVRVSTFTPGPGWQLRGGPFPVTLNAGDQFGARAHGDGRVEVFVNGLLLGQASVAGWPFAASGGRIGLTFDAITASRIENFGGGSFSLNTPPIASIPGAADSSFYVADDTLHFVGGKSDGESPPAALLGHWSTRLIHNNHFHVFVEADGDSTSLITDNHDDGTGVYLLLNYIVTDPGGLRDTATVRLFPENDLEPSSVITLPEFPTTTAPAEYRFRILNRGRLPARISRWRLLAGATQLAEGDTIVAGLDSVEVVRTLAPTLAAGDYDLRVVVDTLGVVVETNETNNAVTRTLTVTNGAVAVGDHAPTLMLSNAFPNPTSGHVRMQLTLPAAAAVRFSVHDLQGREVWSGDETRMSAGPHALEWSGRSSAGSPVRPGLYLVRVRTGDVKMVRRLAVVR